MNLSDFGWTSSREEEFRVHEEAGLCPARVVATYTHLYRVVTPDGEKLASVSGRLRHTARGPQDFPATGDFVAAETRPGEDRATIHEVLPRASCFSRKAAGSRAEEQVVAANVDTVLLVAGLDGDFNPRRVERTLVLAWESGAFPVVVLTKADLCADVASRRRGIEAAAAGVPVIVTSAATGEGLSDLMPHLVPGRTVALLGSSGVGKSTLVNRLLGYERQRTLAVREGDDRGRHATTFRELIPLPTGALVIDTPGLREIQLWAGEESLGDAFGDLAELASACRFRDCRHEAEPGCAVRAAVEEGALDAARLASYHKLGRELRYLETRADVGLQQAQKARWKSIHKQARRHRPRE
ncbi:MAG TPA: ribosome small subunit-dependent GTPase A [Vicinamibacteria bacterium]|nr:ribosome small subunit-dependent GTPase A [Vicinamibacteria bacterium]